VSARGSSDLAIITFRWWYQGWAFLTSSWYQIHEIASWQLKLSVCCCVDYHIPIIGLIWRTTLVSMSRIFHFMLNFLLQQLKWLLTRERLEQYTDTFQRRGVPNFLRLSAVIDTKKQKTCKPGQSQQALYSGHKQINCVKYQTLEGPNGLILHCTLCFDDHQCDGYILWKSGLLNFWGCIVSWCCDFGQLCIS